MRLKFDVEYGFIPNVTMWMQSHKDGRSIQKERFPNMVESSPNFKNRVLITHDTHLATQNQLF